MTLGVRRTSTRCRSGSSSGTTTGWSAASPRSPPVPRDQRRRLRRRPRGPGPPAGRGPSTMPWLAEQCLRRGMRVAAGPSPRTGSTWAPRVTSRERRDRRDRHPNHRRRREGERRGAHRARHRRRRLHRQSRGRAACSPRVPPSGRSASTTRTEPWGGSTSPAAFAAAVSPGRPRSSSATSATPEHVSSAVAGVRRGAAPRRAHRDPLLLRRPALVRGDQRHRHPQRPRGGAPARHAALVNTSTSEVYGTPEEVPITEAHPLRGQSPYWATKIAADKLCESYALSFEHPGHVLRPFNTFGPRQSARAVIPTVLVPAARRARARSVSATRPEAGLHLRHRHGRRLRTRGRGRRRTRGRRSSSAPDGPCRSARSSTCAGT